MSEAGADLLQQLEDILESDPLIDEVGFIHPSQFDLLNEESGISGNSSDEAISQATKRTASSEGCSKQKNKNFWNKDHKLGISTSILLPLYKAAKLAFMTAFKQYKMCGDQSNEVGNCLPASSSCDDLQSILMRHSRSLLLLSCDFMTAWNCRKLVVSKEKQHSMLLDELHLSALVLSHSPKSEQAWNHRRWVIKSMSAHCSNFKDLLRKESELVEKIAERSKMNYRAWNHRCWLISYMARDQVLHELKKSRSWAAMHVADNCCFHYRSRLLLKIMEESSGSEKNVSSGNKTDINQAWKDELDWNETLIRRYVGREALWLHRRFLSMYWINNFLSDSGGTSYNSKQTNRNSNYFDPFLENELCLIDSCITVEDNEFADFEAQAVYAASYMLWLKVQVPEPLGNDLRAKIRAMDLKSLLDNSNQERFSLFNHFLS
ncbi:hypothetical protein HN51_006111 [Arachis hypogaea]|uniref:Protein prenyltransferase alpha subunit repeat-containing protein n=1 Tax=Arachis hypogaea TaxID=3818 RepID=A0A445DC26_ARAHY|nr:protein prenyltransferase alpha subunit repeat-containing protein 1 [Arachis hypogaea]RYR60722.1 hypothetical protein Ahy_A04g017777 [Arachis hypogaea]